MNKVLVVVANPDDEAYGCGGTLFRFRKEWDTSVFIFTDGGALPFNKITT